MLNNALAQTGWSGPALTASNWRETVWARLEHLDWANVAADVRPFLSTDGEAALLTPAVFAGLLAASGQRP